MVISLIKQDITKKQLLAFLHFLPTIIGGLIVVGAVGLALYYIINGIMEIKK